MPLLDVSEVLTDPDFVDTTLQCTRQDQTVGENGRATNAPSITPFAGVVVNDAGDLLLRIAEGERIVRSITIYTKFRLVDGRDGRSADLVTWQGAQYTVTNVANWSAYGAGFVAATCDLLPLSGGAGVQ